VTDDQTVKPARWVRAWVSFDLLVSPDWQNQVLAEAQRAVADEFETGLIAQYASAGNFDVRPVRKHRPARSKESPVDHEHVGQLNEKCGRCGYDYADHERGSSEHA
jgi:hypothetical protein